MIAVQYERGVYLPNENIWLDPSSARPFAFVSHAHSDHIAPHDEIIVSERTARLMQVRLPGKRNEHVLPFGQPTAVRGLNVTLLPAGHIFGSAQFFLETDASTLLYTGDFKLRPGRSAEATEWRRADTLIMETTYGLPRYRLPPTDFVVQQIVAFCREALEGGATPVLLGYSLGKAQEILCSLAEANLQPMLHGSVYRMTRIYEQFGQAFCPFERYDPKAVMGKVLICPPSANRSRMIQRLTNKRVAMISGWAVEPNAVYRYQVDAAFPLSDHADYDDLWRYVELVQPKRVLTLHGFAAEFARDLRDRGIEAWALGEQNQLELTLPSAAEPNRHSLLRRGLPLGERVLRIPSPRPTWRRDRRHSSETGKNPPSLRIPACARSGAAPHRGHFPNRKAIRANRPADLASRMGDPLSRAPRRERARQCRVAPDREQPRRRGQSHLRSARRSNHARALFVGRSADSFRKSAQNARPHGQDRAARGSAEKTFAPSRRSTW